MQMTKPTSQLWVSTWRGWANPAFVEELIGVLVDEVKPSRGGGGFQPTVKGWGTSERQEKQKAVCVKGLRHGTIVGCPM